MIIHPAVRSLLHLPPTIGDTASPVPKSVMRLAYLLPWLLLPSCLWRLPFAFHFEMGMLSSGGSVAPLWLSIPYVFGLSVITEAVALLCIGLVRRWGEVTPAWLPIIGGRPIPPLAAFIPATVGGLILTALFTGWPIGDETFTLAFGVSTNVSFANGWWQALAAVCLTPLRFWGPIVLVLSGAYLVRRRRHISAHSRLRLRTG